MGDHIVTYCDVYINAKLLQLLTRQDGDVTAIPPEASLIVSEPDWFVMCKEAGGEQALIAAMGLTDMRGEE